MLRAVNPVSSSLGLCQAAIQKWACYRGSRLLRFQMLYTRCVCVRSSQHALTPLYLHKSSCHQSLSQVLAGCLDASGKASSRVMEKPLEGQGSLHLHPETCTGLIMVSFQNWSEQAGIILLSFRPALGQPRVPHGCSVPICNWNQGAQGGAAFTSSDFHQNVFFSTDCN